MSKFDPILQPDAYFRDAIQRASTAEDLGLTLEQLLSAGLGVWDDGSLYMIRVLVERVDGLRIVVYTRDHEPPHFHVVAPGIDAKFRIEDCEPLGGTMRSQQERLIQWWFMNGGREKALFVWRKTRPG